MSIWVLGAGGHAAVVIDTLRSAGKAVEGALDDRIALHGTEVLGVPVRGPIALLQKLPEANAIIGIGDRAVAQRLVEQWNDAVRWATVIHSKAIVADSVQVGPGSVVFAGAVVQPRVKIGAHAIINTRVSVDHDCHVEDFAHLAPGVILGGGVQVGIGAMIGLGASVKPLCSIGSFSTIGLGSAVIKDVPAKLTVAGVPASIL